ncbi:MAG: PAS domain S-box protein [Bacteroidia bacterium]|nr:PAS domain S-box protein [Bacteroidia bacterium]
MDKPIRILVLEDSRGDVVLMRHYLEDTGLRFQMEHVMTRPAFERALIEFAPDIILADYTLPEYDGMIALATAQSITPEIPFIFVTGTISIEVAVETLKQGAADYVLKDHLSRLGKVVISAIREHKERDQKRRTETDLLAYERLFNLSLDLLCIIGTDGYFKKINPGFQRMLGYSQEELLSKPFIEFVHAEDQAPTREEFDRQVRGVPTVHFENRYICKDSSVKWLAWTARPDPERGILYSVARDVTLQKKNEEGMRIRDRAMWSSSNGLLITDPNLDDNPIIYVNPAFEKISGYSSSEVIGKNCRFLQKGDRNQRGLEIMRRAIIEAKECKVVLRNYKKNGELFYNEVKISPVMDSNGKVTHFVGILNDISERLKSEQELKESYHTIEAHAKELQQFAYITSHNLRAPVANIQGLLELYERENDIDPDSLLILNKNLRISIETLDRVISDLNAILDIKRNPVRKQKTVRLQSVLEEVLSNLAEMIRQTRIQIISDFSDVPSIITIEPYIHSIFHNLIENAIKYRSPNRSPKVEVLANVEKNTVFITFRDNGLGIDLEHNKENLFGLYKRFHFHVEGKGLGLHMVKQQIEAMGGTIGLQSKPDEGTTFVLTLPMSQEFHSVSDRDPELSSLYRS